VQGSCHGALADRSPTNFRSAATNDGRRHVPKRWKQSDDLGSVAKVGFEATTEASASPRHTGQN